MLGHTALFAILLISSVNSLPQMVLNQNPLKPNPHQSMSLATLACPPTSSPEMRRLTALLPKVLNNAISVTNKSWEIGTLTQSLLEVYHPYFAPFEWDPSVIKGRDVPCQVLNITEKALLKYDWDGSPSRTGRGCNIGNAALKGYLYQDTAPLPLKNVALIEGDGSLGDPCSIGPAVWLLAQLAGRKELSNKGHRKPWDYAWAVGNQLVNLKSSPKPDPDDGAYSMRVDHFSIWADMGYMIPPFLGYLGLASNSSDFLWSALEQHKLESKRILDQERKLYRHMSGDDDEKTWTTGNAWMTYGLLRVLASVGAAGKQDEFERTTDARLSELGEIFTALFQELNSESLLPNYMKETNATFSRGESAGTALVVAAFYRYSVMAPSAVSPFQREKADLAFKGVLKKLDNDGWLQQVVDPSGKNGFNVDDDAISPEGQSFLGMLWAARTAADQFDAKKVNVMS